jgi:hypothetical protein
MKTEHHMEFTTATVASGAGDSTKLVSLLALAAGAISLPQTGNADIIFTDTSTNSPVVGFSVDAASSFTFPNLPGAVEFALEIKSGRRQSGGSMVYYRSLLAQTLAGSHLAAVQSNGNKSAIIHSAGYDWSGQGSLSWRAAVAFAVQKEPGGTSGSYPRTNPNPRYLAFAFTDSRTSQLDYGWIEFTVQNSSYSSGGGPTITILGYAFDDTGAPIVTGDTGQVPEPAPASILALAALIYGARGLRCWRRNRTATAGS